MAATHFSGPVYSTNGFIGATGQVMITNTPAATSITTAGNVTYTAAQLLSGTIVRDPNGAARTDVLPTAALLVAAMGASATVGASFSFLLSNAADAAETVQITMGSGGTSGGPTVLATIAQNSSRVFTVRLTNVTAGAEAYTVYA